MTEVIVYRSKRVADMYLFVSVADDLSRVPEDLLRRFGRPIEAMRLALTKERRLARADARTVLSALDASGYYLQMPPTPLQSTEVLEPLEPLGVRDSPKRKTT